MIKFFIEILTSKRDVNGNCYHAAVVTRTSDGKSLFGTVDAESNTRMYLRKAGVEFEEFRQSQNVLPIRQWNRHTKDWKHIGEKEISEFVNGKELT